MAAASIRKSVAPSSSSRSLGRTPSTSKLLSSSHSSGGGSVGGAQSSQQQGANFTFRHHDLLLGHDGSALTQLQDQETLLDYSDLNERIEMFKNVFNAHLDHVIGERERAKEEHDRNLTDERRTVDLIKERIEHVKQEQKTLYNNVASERQAESSAQSQLALLQASRTSFGQRIDEAQAELAKLQTLLERKKHEFSQRKARLAMQVRRNKPELVRFNEKLGCRISAGHENTPRDRSVIKFTFTLIDPNDWSREAHFVIDASRSQYKILQAKPALPSETIESLLAELNRSRALFAFIKRMRHAFKAQIERESQRRL